MKLTTRISLFFLAALAVVLVGFSASIYWLVRTHLTFQLDDRADDALGTLNAVIESGPKGLEWEGYERHPAINSAIRSDSLVWGVFDNKGQRLDGSQNSQLQLLRSGERVRTARETEDTFWNSEPWRISRRQIHADEKNDRVRSAGVPADEDPKAGFYPSLILAVGTPLGELTSQLRLMAFALAGISTLIWLLAAFFGSSLCRNALSPLTRMTTSVATISAADLSQRLPATNSADELEDLSRAFNDLLDRLQVSFERQRRFAAEASHQLRTPLTAMLGQVDVALLRNRSSDEYRTTLNSVHGQATRLRQIAEMLLFLTRDEADAALPDFELLDVNIWLPEHLATWRNNARFSDLKLKIDRAIPLWIRAHKGLLSQVIDNLIDNACKYSGAGSEIIIRTKHSGNEVLLEIDDTGYGIADDDINRVFDPFFRSLNAQQRGIQGTGLGLSIVQRIVIAFHGKLTIKSQINKGSCFIVAFPSAAR